MVQISRILCPVDFSEFSRRALEHAVALAKSVRAQVTAAASNACFSAQSLRRCSVRRDARCSRCRHRRNAPSDPVLYKTILCPLDFSDSSMRALEYALSLAKEGHARVILLHVLLPLLEQIASGDFDKTARYSLPEYLQSFERVAMKRLKAAVPPDARAWCTPEERVASGKPYRAIIQVAEETGADLIVMGVHGEGVLDRWLSGSTTHHVVREVACPVLTLRA
jgi:nucleotide-binding universal stress UspA family protein